MRIKIVNYRDQKCTVKFFYYSNGRKGITLHNETGKQVARCTLNLDKLAFNKDEVIIKNYGECVGVYEALHKADILRYTKERVPIGYNYGLICKLIK